MNKTIWKLQIISERLWILANSSAQQAAALGVEGRGLAVVSDETRNFANRINALIESCLFEGGEIKPGNTHDLAMQLYLLALNAAIESSRMGWKGKPMAVCADDIRRLAYDVAALLDANNSPKWFNGITPFPKNRITSIDEPKEFLLMNIAGITVAEPLVNIKEVCVGYFGETHITLRNIEIPLVDGYKLLGKPKENSAFVILQTPWAKQNKTYAVAANVLGLFCCPIGKPVNAAADMPLAKYVRECWESETDEPFYFMDWVSML